MIYNGRNNASIPDNIGPTPGECVCAIWERHNAHPLAGYPANVNLSHEFTYTVDAQTPNGVVRFFNVIPAGRRWPQPILVEGLPDRTEPTTLPRPFLYSGSMMDGAFYLHQKEDRWSAPCSFTPSTGGA